MAFINNLIVFFDGGKEFRIFDISVEYFPELHDFMLNVYCLDDFELEVFGDQMGGNVRNNNKFEEIWDKEYFLVARHGRVKVIFWGCRPSKICTSIVSQSLTLISSSDFAIIRQIA